MNQSLESRGDAHEMAELRRQLDEVRDQLKLRDAVLDAVETHFSVAQHAVPESLFVYCNRALAKHHGYTREQLVGKSVRTIAPNNWDAERYQQVRAALGAGEKIEFEDEVPHSDGSSFWVGVTIMPLYRDSQGQVTHTMSIAADITAKKQAVLQQQALQQRLLAEMKKREKALLELRLAQKLESIGRLAAGVAHEINTPIQYVGDSLYFLRSAVQDMLGFLKQHSETIETMSDQEDVSGLKQRMLENVRALDLAFLLDEVPKAFERTFDGIERVGNIVRAMKEFSHPDAASFSSVDLNHALQNTLVVATNEYKYLAKVSTEFDPNLPLVICNAGELNQVFLNLIVNAAHAIEDAGKDVSSGEIHITTSVAGDSVELTFSDNGCGISSENLEKIYDPFFTTKEVGRGTGQGLAITHSIIKDKHGGTLQVYSELGKGTQFIITLPIAGRTDKEAM